MEGMPESEPFLILYVIRGYTSVQGHVYLQGDIGMNFLQYDF